MTIAPAARPGCRLSKSLLSSNALLWTALLEHPWVTAFADGSLPDEAFVRWAQQRRRLAVPLRQALLTLRAYDPPTSLDRWLTLLIDETISDARLLRRTLMTLRVPARDEPGPACLGYGSYIRCCASDGLAEGLTCLYAMQRACLDAWSPIKPASPPGSPRHAWERHWTGDEFSKLVAGLGRSLDQLAAEARPWQLQRVESIFTATARWEYALQTACCQGDGWPV